MNKFLLKTKHGEVINKVDSDTLENAEKMFAEIKRLKVEDLLSMYRVAKE